MVSGVGSITHPVAKYLTSIINPLLGKTHHAIKNSKDFIKMIKDLEVPPPRKLVLYDITILFMYIPVRHAVRVIKSKLEKDPKFQQRCKLTIDQVITPLEFCLNTTYFVCHSIIRSKEPRLAHRFHQTLSMLTWKSSWNRP